MKKIVSENKFIIVIFFLALFLRLFVVSVNKVPSDSMSPILLQGDYIVSIKTSYVVEMPFLGINFKIKKPQKNNLVVVTFKDKPTVYFVRKIVGLPSETVVVSEKKLVLKENEFFVLSENENSQEDSRQFGPVGLEQIEGQAKLILFSVSPDLRINWNRFFTIL